MRTLLTCVMVFSMFSTLTMAADGNAAVDAKQIAPLLVGADVPQAALKTSTGEEVDLAKMTANQPAVLVFYRGNWCPICNKQLKELTPHLGDLETAGFKVFAINQDSAETNAKSMKKNNFGFEVLSDGTMAAARNLGLAFRVDDGTVSRYKDYGIDLVGLYGRQKPELAVPAVLIVKDGKIRFSYVNPDYRERLAPEVIVAAAKSMK